MMHLIRHPHHLLSIAVENHCRSLTGCWLRSPVCCYAYSSFAVSALSVARVKNTACLIEP